MQDKLDKLTLYLLFHLQDPRTMWTASTTKTYMNMNMQYVSTD